MHRFSRMHLSSEAALRSLDTIDLEEKSKVAEGIALIAVIDHRRDYLAAGYSCMRSYCMGRLHMSEDRALRRIQVARAALRFPDLFEYIADGRLSVTTAAVLAPHLEMESAASLMAAAAFRTQREITRLISERSCAVELQLGPASEAIVETTSCQHAAPHATLLIDPSEQPASQPIVSSPAPAPAEHSRRGRVSTSPTGGREVRISITDEEFEDLRGVQALLGHAVPSGDPALIYARALKHYRAHLEKRRLGVKPGAAVPASLGRGIPKPLRKLIWERDGGRCAYVSADGHRCEETGRLEIDHVTPVALGGSTTAGNLRILCRAHNQFEAERILGREHVQQRRELAQRERARAKAAARDGASAHSRNGASTSAGKAPPKTRDAEHQARYDDIHAALRGLGFKLVEARRGAEMADAMPDASLEACVKTALIELTRPLVERGERRARSSA